MAEDEEEERQGPRPAKDNGSPNGVSLDPRILRIACATPEEALKVRDIFPAFVHDGIHGAESQSPALRDDSLVVAKSESPCGRRGEHHPMPARMQATAEDKRIAEGRPTRDYLETTRAFWQPFADRELTREDAREMAHNLIGFFTVLREWTRRERGRAICGVVETTSSSPGRKRGRLRTRAAEKDKMQS
jgi:hypothetical protein